MKTSYSERDYAYGLAMQKLRNTISLTQGRLANRLGISRRAVAEWEAGNSYPKTEHLKELIALAVQQQAFTAGHESEEIRKLWKAAHQQVLLDENWLYALLSQRSCSHPHVEPEPLEETPIGEQERRASGLSLPVPPTSLQTCPAETTDTPPPLPDVGAGSEPRTTIEASSIIEVCPTIGASPMATVPAHTLLSQASTSQPQILPPNLKTIAATFLHHRGSARLLSDGSGPETGKTRGGRKWLLRILIALIILTIIGSAGTLFFYIRDGATKTVTDQAYPGYLSGKGTLIIILMVTRLMLRIAMPDFGHCAHVCH